MSIRWERINSYLREFGFPQLCGKNSLPEVGTNQLYSPTTNS